MIYTLAEENESLYVHVWGYQDQSSTPTTAILNHGASNGNAWEDASPAMTAYNLGNSNGIWVGTKGIASDAAVAVSGFQDMMSYARTFDLFGNTSSPHTLGAYDYLVLGFTRNFGGTVPVATVDHVEVTVPSSDQYLQWAYVAGLGGQNAMKNNLDGDALDNLGEHAMGGNPTSSADIGYLPTSGMVVLKGTNWFEFVHPRRIGSVGEIVYQVESCSNLIFNDWKSVDYMELPTSGTLDADYEAVTKRINTVGKSNEFIRLKIESL